MVLSWTEVKALLTFSSMELAVQSTEDARADADDEEDPELLQTRVAVKGLGQHLIGAMIKFWISGSVIEI